MLRFNFKNKLDKIDLNNLTNYKNKLMANAGTTRTDLNRLRKSSLGGQFWAVSYLYESYIPSYR